MSAGGAAGAPGILGSMERAASFGYRSYVLVVLVIVYTFNFIDRQIVGINNLIGIGLGTTLIGVVSDSMRLRFGAESLRYAILTGTGFYMLAAALLFFAGNKVAKDWV